MKKVLAVVGKGVSGVTRAGPRTRYDFCINTSLWHFTPKGFDPPTPHQAAAGSLAAALSVKYS